MKGRDLTYQGENRHPVDKHPCDTALPFAQDSGRYRNRPKWRAKGDPPGTVRIALIGRTSGGRTALIDAADYDLVSAHRWYMQPTGYAACTADFNGVRTTILMHRLILGAGAGEECDHRNHDKLDNRRANLRLCTRRQNLRNMPSYRSWRYKGVYRRGHGRFEARIKVGPVRCRMGPFETAEAAALCYDAYARRYFRDFAACNFPDRVLTVEEAHAAECDGALPHAYLNLS